MGLGLTGYCYTFGAPSGSSSIQAIGRGVAAAHSNGNTSELKNLRADPANSYSEALFQRLVGLLQARADTGPPLASAYPLGEMNHTASNETCNIGKETGYLLPADYYPLPK